MAVKDKKLYIPLDGLVDYLSRERHLRKDDVALLFHAADIDFEQAQFTGMIAEDEAYSLDVMATMPYTIVDSDGVLRKRRYLDLDEFSSGQFYFSSEQICFLGDLSLRSGKGALEYAAQRQRVSSINVGDERFFCLDNDFALELIDDSVIFEDVDKLAFVDINKTLSPGSFVRLQELSWEYLPVEDGVYLTAPQLQQLSGKSRKQVENLLARGKVPSKSLWGERWYQIDLGSISFFPNDVFHDRVLTLAETKEKVIAKKIVSVLQEIVKLPVVEEKTDKNNSPETVITAPHDAPVEVLDSRYLDKDAIGKLLGINPAAAYERAKARNIPFRLDGRKKLYLVDENNLAELKQMRRQAAVVEEKAALTLSPSPEEKVNVEEPVENLIPEIGGIETLAVAQKSPLTILAEQYFQSRDETIREKIVLQYQSNVRMTAGSVLKEIKALSHNFEPVSFKDLIGSGNIGLLEALNNYDPAKANGAKFETFAYYRIRGEIIDFLRGEDILDRGSRKRVKVLQKFADDYWQEHHAEPDYTAYQQRWIDAGYKTEDFADFFAHTLFAHTVSLNAKIDPQEKKTFIELLHEGYRANNDPIFVKELFTCLEADLRTVPERFRPGVEFYIFEQPTQEEAGKKVGISKSWFSRILEIYVKAPGRFQRTKNYLKGAEDLPLDLVRKRARLASASRDPTKVVAEKNSESSLEVIVDSSISREKRTSRRLTAAQQYLTATGEAQRFSGSVDDLDFTSGIYVSKKTLEAVFDVCSGSVYNYVRKNNLEVKKHGNALFYFVDEEIIEKIKNSRGRNINRAQKATPQKENGATMIEENINAVADIMAEPDSNNYTSSQYQQKQNHKPKPHKDKRKKDAHQRSGDLSYYFSQMSKVPLLKKQEEMELGTIIQTGRKAWLALYNASLPQTLDIIQEYLGTTKTLKIDDLVKQANIGLAKAIDSFDRQGRFLDYARIKVREELEHAVRHWEDVFSSYTSEDSPLVPVNFYEDHKPSKYGRKSSAYYLDRDGNFLPAPASGVAAIDLDQGAYLSTTMLCQLLELRPSRLQNVLDKFPLTSRKRSRIRFYYLDRGIVEKLQETIAGLVTRPKGKTAKREGTKFANKETAYDDYSSQICVDIPLSIDDLLREQDPDYNFVREGNPTERNHLAYEKYQQLIATFPSLSTTQEDDSWPIIDDGKKAVQKMCESNLRLVVNIAKKFVHNHFKLDDAIQEGNIGLMKAATKFEPERGFKFSTYATWWIRQNITRAVVDKGPTIRRPAHLAETETKIRRLRQTFLVQHGVEPTEEQIVALVNKDHNNARNLTPKDIGKIDELFRQSEVYNTFDHPLPGHDDGTMGESVKDAAAESMIYNSYEQQEFYEMLDLFTDHLNDREKYTLIHRFGLYNQDEETLEEIALKFGVTRERIRQVEEKAIRKLKKKAGNNKLFKVFFKEYLNDFNKQ